MNESVNNIQLLLHYLVLTLNYCRETLSRLSFQKNLRTLRNANFKTSLSAAKIGFKYFSKIVLTEFYGLLFQYFFNFSLLTSLFAFHI